MTLKRNLLALAIASIFVGAAHAAPAAEVAAPEQATTTPDTADAAKKKDDNTAELGEIQVTGTFQKSLMKAMDAKRESQTIVEVISAEDIGKLPDSSIAEAISRLPGVAGQRLDGRQNSISVRGFGEDFSATTFNGREQVSIGDNRGVSFDLYPAEIMSGVKVYKTSEASLVAQGIAGTIDLMTVKPLEVPRTLHFGVDAEKNSFGKLNADGKDRGWRGDFAYVDKFAEGKVGVAVAAAILDSPNQEKRWQAWGYPTDPAGDFLLGGAKPFVRSSELKRDTVMAVVEMKPSDNLHVNLDALYIKYKDKKILRGIEIPGAIWGGDYSVISASNGFVTKALWPNRAAQVRNDFQRQDAKLRAFGANAMLYLNGNWSLSADATYSEVNRDTFSLESYSGVGRPNCSGGLDTRTRDNIIVDMLSGNDGARFTPSLNYSDPNLIHLGGAQCWGNGVSVPANGQDGFINMPHVDDKLSAFRLSGLGEFDGAFWKSLTFGVNYADRKKTKVDDGIYLTSPDYPGVGAVPKQFLLPSTDLGFIGMGPMLSYDSYALWKSGYYKQTPGSLTDPNRLLNSWRVDEKVTTYYVQSNFDTALGDTRLNGNFGVQAVHTDQSSSGYAATIDTNGSTLGAPVSGGTSYWNVLPSMNLIWHPTETQQVRFAAARAMSRSRMDRMNASEGYTFDTTLKVFGGQYSNTALKPVKSDQVDLAWASYFSRDSFVSIGTFYKNLTDWQVLVPTLTDFTGVKPPSGQTPISWKGYVSQWQNTASGHVSGIEAQFVLAGGVIHPLLEGFGVTGSATFLDGSIPFKGQQITVPGLSKRIYNQTFFYEKNGFSARISGTYRSDFLGEVQDIAFQPTLVQVKAAHLWDAQVSYTFEKADNPALHGLTLTFQVQNLSNTPFVTYNNGDPRQIRDYQNYGRDYMIGLRYKF
ncbi:MAG: TonB-dependent receptor [Rudaea sp.]|uniref:TonB-dependent receptor n=1 Tax=unclassified Rudaea TaxID=2627037 RepID=UPI0010F43867|nr:MULTISPECIES: TonB-dependent receptor [unclassified Rudaea]MBN8886999.1 TonB-dependent receptor [Rudaea sp.]MBR0344180.1 TonB-dependent receptor [Rudaea sp.]